MEPNSRPAKPTDEVEPKIPKMPVICGKYDFVDESGENIDEYLVGLGVGVVIRKVHKVAMPTVEIIFSHVTKVWTIKTESAFHKNVFKGKFGEEVDYETFDVRPCKATLEGNVEGTKLILHQKCVEGPDVETVYEKTEEYTLVMTMESGGNQALQIFKSPPVPIVDAEEDED